MSERVVFLPRGAALPFPFEPVGRGDAGAWGIVDDAAWLAAGDAGNCLDLLYLRRGDYEHAVRQLAPAEVAEAIALRRATFSRQVPSFAMGLVEVELREVFPLLGSTAQDARRCSDLLTAVASFTTVPRFAGTRIVTLLQYLREGEARIMAELSSPSLQQFGDLDPTGSERATRLRFATELGAELARRGDPDAAHSLPYYDVERAYLITPAPRDLEAAAEAFHEPVVHFRGGLLLSVPDREVAQLETHARRIQVLLPSGRELLALSAKLTGAQLEVELDARVRSPMFVQYVAALRLRQAALRTAVTLIGGADRELVSGLAAHCDQEASRLGSWLLAGQLASPAAPPAGTRLLDVLGTATFLVELSRIRAEMSRVGRLEALTRALFHVVQNWEA